MAPSKRKPDGTTGRLAELGTQPSDGVEQGGTAPESLLVFPCRFPIKAMGPAGAEFEMLVVEIVSRHVTTLTREDVRSRHSSGGKWVSVTLTVEAQSREQLDAIYQDLSAHQAVAWVI
jgi:putative lipoic acid-binding regulatory protein